MDRKDIEIMAPAGNFECLHAAIQGGADSVYFGVERLNMRSHSANNFKMTDLKEICGICREHSVKTYLTLNIVLYNEDLEDMRHTLDAAKEAGITAVIASDMAAIMYARQIGVEVHISTQLSISNAEALRFYAQFADVIVLARELNLNQVKEIKAIIDSEGIKGPSGRKVEIEMFAHGALCMAISGKCYLSLHEYGASANRGSCYQICRRGYEVTDIETGNQLHVDNKYIMSPKDLCTIEFMDKIIDAGVTVFKIEGRARSAEYVKRVASCYRRAADAVCAGEYTGELAAGLKKELAEVFNRGFWDGYYQGARLGEWSEVYGSKATRKKVYCGKVTNWFSKIGVAEILVESASVKAGDKILIIGPSTGVVEMDVKEIRVELKPVQEAGKGTFCSIPVDFSEMSAAQDPDTADNASPCSCSGQPGALRDGKLRRGDKVYIWAEA
ncbi:MAG: U32 family peptidase [Bacteroidales bacterium]|nr:U32 family peptidase [Bacteroidales bacterium]MDE7128628.1 U32 family peptidase [Bacteroidales bacterium]